MGVRRGLVLTADGRLDALSMALVRPFPAFALATFCHSSEAMRVLGAELTKAGVKQVRVLVLRTPEEADAVKSALEPLPPALQERAHDVARRLSELALGQLPTSLQFDERLVQASLDAPDASPGAVLSAPAEAAPDAQGRTEEQQEEQQEEQLPQLGAAMSAVHFRIGLKQLLLRTARVYSS